MSALTQEFREMASKADDSNNAKLSLKKQLEDLQQQSTDDLAKLKDSLEEEHRNHKATQERLALVTKDFQELAFNVGTSVAVSCFANVYIWYLPLLLWKKTVLTH